MKLLKFILILNLLVINTWASETVEEGPLSFKQWKQTQVTESKNRVVRLSNTLLILKSNKYQLTNTMPEVAEASKGEVSSDKNKKNQRLIKQKTRDLEMALARLEVVKELNINDYFAVYLSHFRDTPDAIQQVAANMTKEEVADLIRIVFEMKSSEGGVPPRTKKAIVIGVSDHRLEPRL